MIRRWSDLLVPEHLDVRPVKRLVVPLGEMFSGKSLVSLVRGGDDPHELLGHAPNWTGWRGRVSLRAWTDRVLFCD